MNITSLSIVIPTFRRESVLVETLRALAALGERADEIVVVDQTPRHEPDTQHELEAMARSGGLRWIRLEEPSIPGAMNRGLLEARGEVVLFLDDDILPDDALVRAHREAHRAKAGVLVAGQVLQPGEESVDLDPEDGFRFCSNRRQWISEFPGGNFSVYREAAIRIGGFDEQFVHVAYRFEREFADRFREGAGRILFEPAASIRHLKALSGGTRSFGNHLTTIRPSHAVGAYYYVLVSGAVRKKVRALCSHFWKSIATRFHLRRPWWIPVTVISNAWAFAWAVRLRIEGQRLLPLEARQ